MARRAQSDDTTFIVEYEDGGTTTITVDLWTLRTGDHIARVLANEWQRAGRIPKGKIKSVKRAPGQGPGVPPA